MRKLFFKYLPNGKTRDVIGIKIYTLQKYYFRYVFLFEYRDNSILLTENFGMRILITHFNFLFTVDIMIDQKLHSYSYWMSTRYIHMSYLLFTYYTR